MKRRVIVLSIITILAAGIAAAYFLTRPPDGVLFMGDEVWVMSLAQFDMYTERFLTPDPPRLEIRKWLFYHDYEFQYFYPDTTLSAFGDPERPTFWGRMVYKK